MAAGDDNLVKDLNKELTCSICLNLLKEARCLPCLHSLCTKCLRGLKPKQGSLNCPVCRKPHLLPANGVNGFPINFTINSLVERILVHENRSKIRCGNGIDDKPAVGKCIDCNCYLCEYCSWLHKQQKATRSHTVVSLDEIQQHGLQKFDQKRYCSKHEEENLKIYCKTCQEAICRDCTIVTHKTHEYTFIKDIRDELVGHLEELKGKVQQNCALFAHHKTILEAVSKKSNANIAQCREKIKQYFDDWIRQVSMKQQELVKHLDGLQGEVSKRLAAENEAVELMAAKMESSILFTDQLLKNGTSCDIAIMSASTCKQLNDVKDLKWDAKSVSPCKFSFVGHKTNPIAASIQGRINREQISVKELGQPTVGINSFTIAVLSGAEYSRPVVSIENEKNERLGVPQVEQIEVNVWKATYNIPKDGQYKISVSVDGVEAGGGPFKRTWLSRLPKGTRVRRGQYWKWGDQDGGPNAVGIVTGWGTEVGASDKWVKIKWDNGRQNNYRWGAEDSFDLEIVP